MNFKDFFKNNKPIIVAEIGNNHEGNFETAIRLIDKALEAGADAVKFQTYKIENYYNKTFTEKKRYKKLKKFQLSYEQFEKLSNYSKSKKINFFSTPFDLESALFLNKIQNLFKISSGDNNFMELIKLIIKFNKPIIFSTGLIDFEQIRNITKEFSEYAYKNKLAILHCVSKYPTFEADLNLNSIKFLKEKFPQYEIGYSDHSLSIEACKVALTLGSFIVEKHFTLDKNTSSFHDHKISANPKELNELVIFSKNIKLMLGKFQKKPTVSEIKNSRNMRRSLYASRDVIKDSLIKNHDISWLRPYKKSMNNDISFFFKKRSTKNIKKDTLITKKLLK